MLEDMQHQSPRRRILLEKQWWSWNSLPFMEFKKINSKFTKAYCLTLSWATSR